MTTSTGAGWPIYHLELRIHRCRAALRLNGFPLMALDGAGPVPVSYTPPVNPWLAGAANELELELVPPVDGLGGPALAAALVELSVRRFEKGDIVDPETGDPVTVFTIPDDVRRDLAEGKRDVPLVLRHPFATPQIDFSSELRDAPVIEDQGTVLDYAMRLRTLAGRHDTAGLLAEHEPKIAAWAAAYDEKPEAMAASLGEGFERLLAAPDLGFAREHLTATPYCGGRIWEVTRPRGVALLRSMPDADLGRMELRPLIGLRGGALRVVR